MSERQLYICKELSVLGHPASSHIAGITTAPYEVGGWRWNFSKNIKIINKKGE